MSVLRRKRSRPQVDIEHHIETQLKLKVSELRAVLATEESTG